MSALVAPMFSPFVLLLLLAFARPLTHWLRRALPDGPVKRFLFISWRV